MFKKKPMKVTVEAKKAAGSDAPGKYGADNTPFFVLGCVRSGTTLLRDILKEYPRLESPEETHFFRWSDPYGSPRYNRHYLGTKLFHEHHQLDGVSEHEFVAALSFARNRKEMSEFYAKQFLAARGKPGARWFDKTPQNVYGLLLINYMYPQSKFVHIYRNPLNVVASLKEGKVMAKHDTKGAINYWLESMILINEYKKMPGAAEKFIEIKYESMTEDPKKYVSQILEFVGEDPALMDYRNVATHKEKDKYKKVLTQTEIEHVKRLTEPFYSMYGYR